MMALSVPSIGLDREDLGVPPIPTAPPVQFLEHPTLGRLPARRPRLGASAAASAREPFPPAPGLHGYRLRVG
jgi:hypothetical protein